MGPKSAIRAVAASLMLIMAVAATPAAAQRGGKADTRVGSVKVDPSRWIVYADKVGIHLIHPDGSDGHMLVSKWGARYPSWSPDGKWIAYAQLSHASYETSKATIRIVRVDGHGRRILVHGTDPEWLSARWILFEPPATYASQSFALHPNSAQLFKEVDVRTGVVKSVVIPHVIAKSGQWVDASRGFTNYDLSPSRDAIYWVSYKGDPPSGNSCQGKCLILNSVNLDGTDYHRLAVKEVYELPAGGWMPSGREVLYDCSAKGDFAAFCVANLATGKTRRLHGGSKYVNVAAAPAPRGNRMIVDAANALYTIHANGAHSQVLFKVYTPSGNPTSPGWQP